MAIKHFRAALSKSSPETLLSILAVAAGLVNLWLGLLVGVVAAYRFTQSSQLPLQRNIALWFFVPTAMALVFLGQGKSLPADDLLRHLTAGGLGYDYRAQYPWANLPKANLWLGFDWVLWQLRELGVSKEFLRQWVPGLGIVLQSVVLYVALKRAVPAHRTNPGLLLIMGSLGLLLVTPRSLLGRPEVFMLIFAAAAWMPRSITGCAAWALGYLALIPAYWLGWVYAPFALLLWPGRLTLSARIGIAVLLAFAHLAFWQLYTGDYLGLMAWLEGTLSVKATENLEMLHIFSGWQGWVFFILLVLGFAGLSLRKLKASAGVFLLLAWLTLPNQVRYLPALALVALPWLYRRFTIWAHARAQAIPPLAVMLSLGAACAFAVPSIEKVPEFKLPATARVYSESPYAAVYFGQRGISVDPSFALGATKKPWDDLKDDKKQSEHCRLLQEGQFTHLIESSRTDMLECGVLKGVDGPWRLWELTR